MKAPQSVANAARSRISAATVQISHSLKAIREGCPGDAEPDKQRQVDVYQVRTGVPASTARAAVPKSGAEAIWLQTIDFVDVAFFERGQRAARAVCRIASRTGPGIGTGFLISPRLLLTNNHVISSESAARSLVAEFDYELDIEGQPRPVTRFALAPEVVFLTDDRDNLDFTVVALGPRLAGAKEPSSFGFLPISSARNKHVIADLVNIIQHPDGRLKEAVVRENQIVSRPKSGTVLHYVADTEPGSSGSPVFNVRWQVVALHHWGGPHRELYDEKGVRVPRTVNEGIRASSIVLDLETRKAGLREAGRRVVEEALALGVEAAPAAVRSDPSLPAPGERPAGGGPTLAPDGTVTWQIPVSISVRVGGSAVVSQAPGLPPLDQTAEVPSTDGTMEARLELDDNYDNRDGYDRDFLGESIALPALSTAARKNAAKNREASAGADPFELPYEHFSIVMNGKRRLAFFTATNIDGSKAKDVNRKTGAITTASGTSGDDEDEGAEAAEQWFVDRRIDEDAQTPSDLYSGQTAFDAAGNPIVNRQTGDHRNRIFQQGHLTRRQDPLWGTNGVVNRAHADTFHVTNRAPQVGFFNMGIFKPAEESGHPGGTLHWRALEDYVLENARADRQRVTVFTGPIFDDNHDIPWSRGRDDMKGFKAPREYWKVVVRVEQGALQATALIADQSPLIDFVPELIELSAEEAKRVGFEKVARYHVTIAELERRTGLTFDSALRAADTFPPGEERTVVPVERLDDLLRPRVRENGRKARGRNRAAVSRLGARPRPVHRN